MLEVEVKIVDARHLYRPIVGNGGWQHLLRRLREKHNPWKGTIKLTEEDQERILSAIETQGGWQSRVVRTFFDEN